MRDFYQQIKLTVHSVNKIILQTDPMSTHEKECYNVSGDVTSVQRGHHSRDCKSKKTCFRCKGRHHASICERDKNSSRKQTNNDQSNDSKKSDDNKDSMGDNEQAQQPNRSRIVTYTMASNNKVVLMQTATIFVNSKQSNYNKVKCRLLFDSGSQRTYVSRTLVDAIEAETIRTEYLAVGTFEASTTKCLPKDVVSITVSDKADQESIQIKPNVLKKIWN